MDLLHKLLTKMREVEATDLLLSAGTPPAFRVHGKLAPRRGDRLEAKHLDHLVEQLLTQEQQLIFTQEGEMNIASGFKDLGRFRVNLFKQRGNTAIAIRAIPQQIPTLSELGLPDVLQDVVMQRRGLLLFVGACGSGKSTAMAALLNHRNQHDDGHIITIEDPIEYHLRHDRSMVNQREVGIDTRSYQQALVNALRQSPDVLAIGEIRTRQAMEQAIEFSSTGHLCLATLHANNTYQAFDRIVNWFEETEREQIMACLSQNVRAVLSQHLVPTLQGGRTAAYELLLYTPHVADIIRRGEFEKIRDAMEKHHEGMQTFDACLFSLHQRNIISQEIALDYADSPSNLKLRIKLETQTRTGTE